MTKRQAARRLDALVDKCLDNGWHTMADAAMDLAAALRSGLDHSAEEAAFNAALAEVRGMMAGSY